MIGLEDPDYHYNYTNTATDGGWGFAVQSPIRLSRLRGDNDASHIELLVEVRHAVGDAPLLALLPCTKSKSQFARSREHRQSLPNDCEYAFKRSACKSIFLDPTGCIATLFYQPAAPTHFASGGLESESTRIKCL